MSSPDPPRRHLDATQGREVIYCHACENEWYRDEHAALECPRCQGEVTEIISPENDPRIVEDEPPAFGRGPPVFDNYHESDSDPEEADIEQHVHRTPTGFFMHRTIRSGQGGQGANHQNELDVIQRFSDMLMEFNGGRPGRSGPDVLFPPIPPIAPAGQEHYPAGGGMPAITRTTFRRTPFGATSVTIINSGGPPPPGGFNAIFSDMMNNGGPPAGSNPTGADNPNGPNAQPGQGQPAFPALLQGLLAMFLDPAGAAHGDAVYTQEALDRIVTQLMEQNQQSNGAPPASQEAIAKLGKKQVELDDLGLDGKAECTICIDELHVGDEVTVLPCKHWFHGECVTLWLKEHNTCPICRSPIEGGNRNNNNNSGSQQQQPQQQSPGQGQAPQDPAPSNLQTSRSRYERLYGNEGASEERLNTIRDLAGGYQPSVSRTTSSFPTQSHSQRRSSHSPPPEPSSRTPRVRSPASRSRNRFDSGEAPPMSGYREPGERSRPNRDSESEERQGSHGPLSWLRDQFSRHSGSGGSGSGDNRRRS